MDGSCIVTKLRHCGRNAGIAARIGRFGTHALFILHRSNYLVWVTLGRAQLELPVSLAKNIDLLRHLPKLSGLRFAGLGAAAGSSPLQEVTGFGSNPGNLRMLAFVPAQWQQPRALVVVLHGCGQTAAAYDLGAGWSTLANHYGFALLMPEQQRINNANTCFNWFNPEDIARDTGEARSIREMVAHMARTHGIDPRRVFITGLSAGGGMTSVMLAVYPEVFAAGARARRSRPQRLAASWTLAESLGVAWQRRSHRQPGQCRRDRQAMARSA